MGKAISSVIGTASSFIPVVGPFISAGIGIFSAVKGAKDAKKSRKQAKRAQALQAEQFRIQQEAQQKQFEQVNAAEKLKQEKAQEINNAQRLQEIRDRRVRAAVVLNQFGTSAGLSSSGLGAGSSIGAGLIGNLARADTLSNLDAGIAGHTQAANVIGQQAKADIGNLEVGVRSAQNASQASSARSNLLFQVAGATVPSVSQFEELFKSSTPIKTTPTSSNVPVFNTPHS